MEQPGQSREGQRQLPFAGIDEQTAVKLLKLLQNLPNPPSAPE
jgi:hypothetical protein